MWHTFSLQCFDTAGWATGRAAGMWKKLGVDLLVVTIFDWNFARLIAPVVTTNSIILSSSKSRMETFWYRLTWVALAECTPECSCCCRCQKHIGYTVWLSVYFQPVYFFQISLQIRPEDLRDRWSGIFKGRMPFLDTPNQQCQSTEDKYTQCTILLRVTRWWGVLSVIFRAFSPASHLKCVCTLLGCFAQISHCPTIIFARR